MLKIRLVLCILILCILTACGNNTKKQENVNDEDSEEITAVISMDYPWYDTADSLVEKADLVFSGVIEKVEYEKLDLRCEEGPDPETGLVESKKTPCTIYTIKIEKVYKGNYGEERVKISLPGGVADGMEYVLEGAPDMSKNVKYLFLTSTYENSYPSLLNLSQACFNMDEPAVTADGEENNISLSEVLKILEEE